METRSDSIDSIKDINRIANNHKNVAAKDTIINIEDEETDEMHRENEKEKSKSDLIAAVMGIANDTDLKLSIYVPKNPKDKCREHRDNENNHYVYRQNLKVFILDLPKSEPVGMPMEYSPDRNGFVRLVFTIVFVMLSATFTFSFFAYNIDTMYNFGNSSLGGWTLAACAFGCMCISYMMDCSNIARRPPCNIICLMIATALYSVICAIITSTYRTELILIAVGVTILIVVVCFLLACTDFDFTKFILLVMVAGLVVFAVLIVMLCLKFFAGIYYKPLHVGLLVVASLISCITLVMELQMILGGKTVELGTQDYAYGALLLYTSIVSIFLKILLLLDLIEED